MAFLTAAAISMTWGISALMLAAIPVYLVVGWVYPPGGGLTPARTPP